MDFFSNNRVSNLNFKHGEQTSIGIEDNKKNISYSISPEEVVSTPIKIRTSDNLNVVDESAGKLFWSLNKKTEGLPERVESKVINFNNGYFCVVNRSRNIFYSTNLKSWEKVFTPKNSFSIANLIEFNGLLWTATRKRVKSETEESYSYEFCVYNSKYGFVWNEVASFTSEKAIEANEGNQEIRGFCVDEGNNRLVLSSGSFVITVTPSESDYNFELIETGLPATCWTLSYFDGIFVAGTNSGFYKSTDLSNGSWTKFLEQETGNCYLSCKINGFYFLGGVNLYRSISPDGTFEEVLSCPAYCPPIDIVYVNNKYFVSLNGEAVKYQGDKVLYYSTTSDRDSWEDGLNGFTNALDSAWTLSVVDDGNTLLISSSTSGLSGVNVYGTGSSKELATKEYVDNISTESVSGLKENVKDIEKYISLENSILERNGDANVYGWYGSVSSLGLSGSNIKIKSASVYRRTGNNADSGSSKLYLRVLKKVDSSWSLISQSENGIAFNDYSEAGSLIGPFVFSSSSEVLEETDNVALVFVSNEDAEIHSSVHFGAKVNTSTGGGLSSELPEDSSSVSTLNYSPVFSINYLSKNDYYTKEEVDELISGAGDVIDTTNLVTIDTSQDISGVKNFTSRPTINNNNVISVDNVATTSSFGVVKVGGKGISINNGVLQLNHPTNYSGFNYSGNEVSVNVKSTEHPESNTTAHTALEASTGKIVVLNATTSVPGGVKLATGIDDAGSISVLTASQVKEVIDGIETENVEIPVATTEISGTVLLSEGFDSQELDTRVLTKDQVITELYALDRPLILNISNETAISTGVDYTIDLYSDLANFEKIPMIQFFDSEGNNVIVSYKYDKENKQIVVKSNVDVAIGGLMAVVYATTRPVPLSR